MTCGHELWFRDLQPTKKGGMFANGEHSLSHFTLNREKADFASC